MPSTGLVPVEGGSVWYEVHGTGTRTPLLVLHGGPGIPHDYLANLALLGDERPVSSTTSSVVGGRIARRIPVPPENPGTGLLRAQSQQ